MTAVLIADGISKRFGAKRVLSGATLRAFAGQIRLLVGRNGSGKSTLLRIAAGWLRADSGVVHLAGRAYPRPTPFALARRGMLHLPEHDALSRSYSVRQQLEWMWGRFHGWDVRDVIDRLGLASIADRSPDALSGGELRRAEMAIALVRRPACLLMDEPFRGVCPADVERLSMALRELSADGCAVVVTGHEVTDLLTLADAVTWCAGGLTDDLGTPEQVLRERSFIRDYLGPSWLPDRRSRIPS